MITIGIQAGVTGRSALLERRQGGEVRGDGLRDALVATNESRPSERRSPTRLVAGGFAFAVSAWFIARRASLELVDLAKSSIAKRRGG